MTALTQQIQTVSEIAAKVTSSSAKDIVDAAASAVLVPWLQVNENAGATPNLTVELYDGTTSYYLGAGGATWVAKAVTAKQSLLFEDIVVPRGWKLRVTSSDAAGKFDVVGMKSDRALSR